MIAQTMTMLPRGTMSGMSIRIYINIIRTATVLLLGLLLLGSSSTPPEDRTQQVRAFTRNIEFDYIGWTADALWIKFAEMSGGTDRYLSNTSRRQAVLSYLELVSQIQQRQSQLTTLYADPNIADKQIAAASLSQQIDKLRARRRRIAPVAEAILESQISDVVSRLGLTAGGQPIPPVLFHSTPLPDALIVSPRNIIRQEEDISLVPDLGVDEHVALEEQVDHALNVSSLVVSIGGVGVYPTMVAQTTDIAWLSETVAHEWVHNYLTLRPLGINYLTSPELRTMNETTASIAGKEISRVFLEQYYAELLPPATPAATTNQPVTTTQAIPDFDFNTEMRKTRIAVDQYLKQGEIEAAEIYMEKRRVEFWEHGYHSLRKLNQAYFAFHGAYADHPSGGAAGEDPVGAAVRSLRAQSASLAEFLYRMAWMSSFEQLKRAAGSSN